MTNYQKNLCEPWFTLLKLGIKTVEGRLNKHEFIDMKIGDYITFKNMDLGFERTVKLEIKSISVYDNFTTYLEKETLANCLPGIETLEEGLKVYKRYYPEYSPTSDISVIKAFHF